MCCKRLFYGVFLIFREDTNCNGGFSIPVHEDIDMINIVQRYTTDFGLYLVFIAAKRYLKTAKLYLRKLSQTHVE